MQHQIEQFSDRIVGVKLLYAKIKNHQIKKFTKEMTENGFYARIIFEKGSKNTKNGFMLLLIFQPVFVKGQLIEGHEVFRNVEKKGIDQYASYGYISLKNLQGQLIRLTHNEYDVKRSRISLKVMQPLKIKLKKEMANFWDSNFWSKYATSMCEQAISMDEIQEALHEKMLQISDANANAMVKRCLDNYYKYHYATAS